MLRNFLNEFFCFFVETEKFKTNFPQKMLGNKSHAFKESVFWKFKKIFYVFSNYFTSRVVKVIFIFIMKAILIPCLIIFVTAYPVQVMAKVMIGDFIFIKTSISDTIKIKWDVFVTDVNKCLIEDSSKFLTSLNKFFSPVSAYGETITNKVTEQQRCDRKQWIGNYFDKECYRKSDLTIIFIIGFELALVIASLWDYFFTQRSA